VRGGEDTAEVKISEACRKEGGSMKREGGGARRDWVEGGVVGE